MRIVQLTDPHLMEDPSVRLRGIDTRRSFLQVLEVVRRDYADAARIVITGDVAHDERPQTYFELRRLLGDLAPLVSIVPGNHDDVAGLRSAFERDTSGPKCGFVDEVGQWILIGLDSHVDGRTDGTLGQVQRAWLDHQCQRFAPRPIIVFVHHPPVPLGRPWIDGYALTDGPALVDLVGGHPHVHCVAHGHVHCAGARAAGAVPVLATPSTAFQFVADDGQPRVDAKPPGLRVFDLGDDRYSTAVRWVLPTPQTHRFPDDLSAIVASNVGHSDPGD